MKSLILGSLFLFFNLCHTFSQASLEKQIDEIFKDWNTQDQPGCVVGVFHEGKELYKKAFGLANLEHDIPVNLSTTFQIGSISKQFTAASIVLLSLDSLLSLEDPLIKYFPEFPPYAAQITLKQLMHHTSGIRDYDQLIQYSNDCDVDCFYEDNMLALLSRQENLNFKPGSEHMYSNSGYWLLGQIVEKVTGKSLNQFTKENIFQPLRMQHTFFLDDYTQIVKNRALGYFEDDDMPQGFGWYNTIWALVGDGGLFTTLNDFKKWEDEFSNQKKLGAEFWSLMLEKGRLIDGSNVNCSGGLEHSIVQSKPSIEHNGTGFGYSAKFVRIPMEELMVVVLTNLDGAYFIEDQINAVLDLFLERQEEVEPKQPEVERNWNPKVWESFCGYYWQQERLYSRHIFLKDDTLWYGRNKNSAYPLFPIEENHFTTDRGFSVKFELQENGNFQMSLILEDGTKRLLHPYQTIQYSEEDLLGFVGLYYSKSLNTKYELKLEKGVLKWLVEGDVVSTLSPIMENMFRSEGGTNFRFFKETGGQIKGFKLGNLRLRHIQFEKIK